VINCLNFAQILLKFCLNFAFNFNLRRYTTAISTKAVFSRAGLSDQVITSSTVCSLPTAAATVVGPCMLNR